MDAQTRRDAVHNYILSKITSDIFNHLQGVDFHAELGAFGTYEDFIENQRSTLGDMDEARVDFFYRLVSLMPNIHTSDKEDMLTKESLGFFLIDNRCIVLHE